MQIDMRPLRLGKWLLVSLGFLHLSGCRDSVPPKIEICIGDGFGGADCIEADGSQLYKSPSALKNYWMTNEPDEANYTSWCYDTTSSAVQSQMAVVKEKIQP